MAGKTVPTPADAAAAAIAATIAACTPAELGARECTPAEGIQWQDRYSTGYSHGRSDALNGEYRPDVLAEIPAEVPGECGARYVARHLDLAYRIGYTRAMQFYAPAELAEIRARENIATVMSSR